MTISQLRKGIKELKDALNPGPTGSNIFIYDPETGIPEELLIGEGVRIFIPENGRDPGHIHF